MERIEKMLKVQRNLNELLESEIISKESKTNLQNELNNVNKELQQWRLTK